MNRTEEAYRALFARLFPQLSGARRDHAVELQIERARALAGREHRPFEEALRRSYEEASACQSGAPLARLMRETM